MKRKFIIRNIPKALLLSLLCLGSCGEMPEDIVELGKDGYISFSCGTPTKSNLVEVMDGLDFDVIAYKYSKTSDWNVFRSTGKPENGVDNSFMFPTLVKYNAGMWQYDRTRSNGFGSSNPVAWASDSKYAFFAVYPKVDDGVITMMTDANTANAPWATYTAPSPGGDGFTDISSMCDVMHASVKDITSSVQSGTVRFQFDHVMSCLTVEARNFDDKSEGGQDETIKNLKVYFTTPTYDGMDFSLEQPDPLVSIYPSIDTDSFGKSTRQFVIQGAAETKTVPAKDGKTVLPVIINEDKNIFIVPQEFDRMDRFEGYISFIDKSGKLRTGLESDPNYDSSLRFSSEKSFEPGKRYSLMINFTNGVISIAIIQNDEWIDVNQEIIFQ
ncbi:MAG: fimbrillin family protein [Bacteroidales bacterium]|nr:fimbrillin family protein [Bacteroidales bacterium]